MLGSVYDADDGCRTRCLPHGGDKRIRTAQLAANLAVQDCYQRLPANQRMGWSFPWASSLHSDFNFDFSVSFTEESVAPGAEYICLSKARPSLSNTVPYQVRSF